jgi:large conductance mechanosensitive channel
MGMLKEFKEFAVKGNIVDLAIAVVLGGAFGAIIKGLTTGVIMPLISLLVGKRDFSELSFMIGGTEFPIGVFVQSVIDFILIAFVLFLIVKAINKLHRKQEEAAAPTPEEILLLREIRDNLKR